MIRYIIRRLLWGLVLLLAVIMITFIVFFLLPNVNPAVLRAGRTPSQAVIKEIANDLGTNKPIYTQFWLYMQRLVLHFNLGYSYYSSASVKSLILDRLPATISLTVGGVIIWLADWHTRRDHLRDQAAYGARSRFDGHGAAVRLRTGLLARAARPVLLLLGHRPLPGPVPARSRQLHGDNQQSDQLVRIAAHAVVRAGGDVGGDLRPPACEAA